MTQPQHERITAPLSEQCEAIPQRGRLLEFELGERKQPDSTLYNPSIPFPDVFQGEVSTLILLRHESLYSETDSEVLVFDYNKRTLVPNAPVFKNMQDPYYLGRFRDEDGEYVHIVGGVKISVDNTGKITGYQDAWFKYKQSILELGRDPQPWMEGVPNGKDMRAIQFNDGIEVMPRPQGPRFGGAGQIGIFRTKHLGTLERDLLQFAAHQDPASLIDNVFPEGHWGGANQLLGRPDSNIIHVLGHGACLDDDRLKRYEPTYLRFNRVSRQVEGPVTTLATADDFPALEPKPGHQLGKIVFTAGLAVSSTHGGGFELVCGVGDRTVGVLPLPRTLLQH